MIQRKQTIFLGVAAVMLIVTAVALGRANQGYDPTYLVPQYLAGAMAIASLIAVFLYGHRDRQYRVVGWIRWACILVVLAVVGGALLGGDQNRILTQNAGDFGIAVLAAVVSFGLVHAAARAIMKDIKLIESMNRVR